MCVFTFSELNGNEKPVLRTKGAPKKNKRSNRYRTGSFWLNNNNLKSVNGLRNLADRLLEMADYLSWLDLSGNNLTMVSHVSTCKSSRKYQWRFYRENNKWFLLRIFQIIYINLPTVEC